MDKAQGSKILVMDVEGTDGRERADDQVGIFVYRGQPRRILRGDRHCSPLQLAKSLL